MTESLEQHWRQFRGELKRFVRSRVQDDATAEDVLQSTFLKAHVAFSQGQTLEHPRAWLFQIARNLVIDLRRSEQRSQAALDDLKQEPVDGEDPSDADTAFALVAKALPVFIVELEEPYRRALELTELQGMSQVEAARVEGISVSGMKSRVQRGRRRVHEAMLRCCHLEVDGRGRVLEAIPRSERGCKIGCGETC